MKKDWAETIKKWLEEGKDNSKDLIGLPWDIDVGEEDNYHYIVAQHPKIPFAITIYINEYFANLYIITNIETDSMELVDRMHIYKSLLHMNSDSNLFKVGLMGNTDKIVNAVDLDLKSLGKAEFNDALSALVAGTYKVIQDLDLQDDFENQMFERLADMILQKLNEGMTKDEVREFLTRRVGMDKEEAESLVNSIIEHISKSEEKNEAGTLNYIS